MRVGHAFGVESSIDGYEYNIEEENAISSDRSTRPGNDRLPRERRATRRSLEKLFFKNLFYIPLFIDIRSSQIKYIGEDPILIKE